MERRVLLAIFLSFLVLYVYQALFTSPVPNPGSATAGSTPSGQTPAQPEASSIPAAGIPQAAALTGAPASTAKSLLGDTEERDLRVETPHVIAVFTNRGGRLKSWRLKEYLNRQGQPLELVVTELATSQPLPFSLQTSDA